MARSKKRFHVVLVILGIAVLGPSAYGIHRANQVKLTTLIYYSENKADIPVYGYKDSFLKNEGTDFYEYLRSTCTKDCDDAFYALNLDSTKADYDITVENDSPNLVAEYSVYRKDDGFIVFDAYNYKHAILKQESSGYLIDKISYGRAKLVQKRVLSSSNF